MGCNLGSQAGHKQLWKAKVILQQVNISKITSRNLSHVSMK